MLALKSGVLSSQTNWARPPVIFAAVLGFGTAARIPTTRQKCSRKSRNIKTVELHPAQQRSKRGIAPLATLLRFASASRTTDVRNNEKSLDNSRVDFSLRRAGIRPGIPEAGRGDLAAGNSHPRRERLGLPIRLDAQLRRRSAVRAVCNLLRPVARFAISDRAAAPCRRPGELHVLCFGWNVCRSDHRIQYDGLQLGNRSAMRAKFDRGRLLRRRGESGWRGHSAPDQYSQRVRIC